MAFKRSAVRLRLAPPSLNIAKQPWYFTARDGAPGLTVAALWDSWKNKETSERIKSCAMIVSEPNDFVAEVHDRMPVLSRPSSSTIG